jgi:hypothetical protein
MSSSFDFYRSLSMSMFDDMACVSWVRTADSEGLVRRFGGDPEGAAEGTWEELLATAYEDLDEDEDGAMLAVRHGEWLITVEPFNFRGAVPEVLSGAGQEAYSVCWTGTGQSLVTYATAGEVVARFDAYDVDALPPTGLAWLDGHQVTAAHWREDWRAAALALGEELSGVRMDEDWLARPRPMFTLGPVRLPRRPRRLRVDDEIKAIAKTDPRIAMIIDEPTPDKAEEIIRMAAEMAVTTAGIEGPDVTEALELIAAGDRRSGRADEVRSRLARSEKDFRMQAREAYAALAPQDREDWVAPGHGTTYGRLMIKAAAAAVLQTALTPGEEPAAFAIQVVNDTGGVYLSSENGNVARHRALSAAASFIEESDPPH